MTVVLWGCLAVVACLACGSLIGFGQEFGAEAWERYRRARRWRQFEKAYRDVGKRVEEREQINDESEW